MKGLRFAAVAVFGAMMAAGGIVATTAPAGAVIYCKTAGVPRGCAARPMVHQPVVYCKRVGYPKGCVMR